MSDRLAAGPRPISPSAPQLLGPAGPTGGAGLASLPLGAGEQTLLAKGQTLAVPQSAVIDTGNHKVVYREAGPSLYEGVEVEIGPRCGEFYPVVKGLEVGDKVATAGSFLIDAETRLAGGLGSTNFGASAGPQQKEKTTAAATRPSATSEEDGGGGGSNEAT